MSEFNSEHHERAPNLEALHEISPEEIAQFMGEVDEKHIDKPFVVDFGGGKESWILYDAVNSDKRDDKGEVTGRVPTVRLQSPEDAGRYFDLPTSQFMEAILKAHEPDVEGGSPELTVENPRLDHEARRDSVVADIAGELGLPENTSPELLMRDIGQKIEAEGGHNKTSHEKIAVAIEKYRNEQVEKWAQELSGQDITPERAKEIASEMQNAVAIEAGMVDDPNSPRKWFGNRILENSGKRRADINHTGREAAQIGSQQYVTEIMTDILTGKFRVHSLIDPIEMKGNRVETGQHRVAALAMMYGDRWPEKALAMGQRIDQV